jgi:hypothetical protein
MINMFLNALFGDGCIDVKESGKIQLRFISTCKQVIEFKANLINGNVTITQQHKDAWEKTYI